MLGAGATRFGVGSQPSACAPAALAAVIALTGGATSRAAGGTGAVRTVTGTFSDGATYEIQLPAVQWNGTLVLYSHGYVTPGSANPAQDVGDPLTGGWLLDHGYALAGSSYATTGWAIQQAIPDQIDTLNTFDAMFGKPTQHDRLGVTRSAESSRPGSCRMTPTASRPRFRCAVSSPAASARGTRRSTPSSRSNS